MLFPSIIQFSVYSLKEPLNVTRCKAFQRFQWGFRSYRIWCCEIGNCLRTFRNSIVISSTTDDKTLNVVFCFMWINIMLKVHSCRCKCSFLWIIYLQNLALISNSWQLNRFWTSEFSWESVYLAVNVEWPFRSPNQVTTVHF